MNLEKVNVREFRAHLANYLETDEPVALTRHGETVGFYVPIHRPSINDREAFKDASQRLSCLLDALGETEDSIANDFDNLKKQGQHEDSSSCA
jgi:antitoxin (DNA-binding transcriptional repressor) of toxin-antitoxin stability system